LATLGDRFGRREPPDPAPVWYEAVMWVAMSAAGREEFVAGVHVGVLSAALGTAGQTLAVPVWYSYQPGGLVTVLTGRRSRKAAAIRAAGRFGLCAQDARPTVMSASRGRSWPRRNPAPPSGWRWPAATLARRAVITTSPATPDPGRENVAFRMRPEHWLSQDQGKGQAKR
jgi:hypothetical protein